MESSFHIGNDTEESEELIHTLKRFFPDLEGEREVEEEDTDLFLGL